MLNPAPLTRMGSTRFAGLVDVLVPNEIEAAALSGIGGDPLSAATSLRQQLDAAVIVTVGEKGRGWSTPARTELLAAHDVDAVDTVGAGDAFCGALGARLAAGASLREATVYANAAAALSRHQARRRAEHAEGRRHRRPPRRDTPTSVRR